MTGGALNRGASGSGWAGLLTPAITGDAGAGLHRNLNHRPREADLLCTALDLPRSLPLQQGLRHKLAETWG